MPLDSDVFAVPHGYNAPQQVHITQGDLEGRAVIVSWTTMDEPGSNKVLYWKEHSKEKKEVKGKLTKYKFYNYTSGFIHHCTIKHLEHGGKYYYEVGIGHSPRAFWFTTPPKSGLDVPYTFGLIGDLGQSYDSNKTLTHYEENPFKGHAVLFVGDLSYADNYPNHDNVRWDTWGRFVERSAAYQPWIWTVGNHEIDFAPGIGETKPFKPFSHRYSTPYKASNSTGPFWYSIKRGPAYIIVLASYSAYGKYTPQFNWLEEEFPKVNRTETPWLIVLMHAPWYNSYNYHYMEGETMRVITKLMSSLLAMFMLMKDLMTEPQPDYSAFREASFGHAIFDIKNHTHAYYAWHRNQDGYRVEADKMLFFNRYWNPIDDSTRASS
ncbi:Purple acid phosphatase 2-like protein [Drosera capensis]